MILIAGPERAVSFTDDTSPDTRKTKQRSVSIHAKVRKGTPLDWYYDLIRPFQKEKGELKSAKVLDFYRSMSPLRRTKLWETLKDVQINITDSLPYQERVHQNVKEAFKREDAVDYIRQRAIANDPHAKWLLEQLNNHTAESILLDAPSRQLSTLAFYAREYPMGGYGLGRYLRGTSLGFRRPPDHEIPLSRFQSANKGSIVRTVTKWTAMSASVFSDAMDEVFTAPFYHHHPLLDPVYRALRQSHAFDDGNKKLVDLTDDERSTVARHLHPYNFWMEEFPFSPLYEVKSRQSFFIQATDIASGIASFLYEHGQIVAVAQHFVYVIFNGRRISHSDAYEIMRKWRERKYLN
jgi:hypothetical protein